MTTRSKAFFNGIEVQVEWEMTRSHGTVPDVGRLVFRQGGTLPSSPFGDLVLTNGSTEIIRFKDCMLNRPQEKFGRTRDILYQILDRRWRWKTPTIFGQYNTRDENNELIVTYPDIRKNAQELAILLLKALHDAEIISGAMTVADFDVSVLPTDVSLAPYVDWKYTPAAVELEKLCAFFSCSVVLLNNNKIKIVEMHTGTEPDNVGLKHPVESGLVINPAPPFVTAYAGDTWFDGWLATRAVGMELGGEIKPIEQLSYAPAEGWVNTNPKVGFAAQITQKLRGTVSQELIDKTIEIANRTVLRMWKVVGFPELQVFWPGFTLEDPVTTLPATGEFGKIYQKELAAGWTGSTRTAFWDGEKYVGMTLNAYSYDASGVVDINKISDMTTEDCLIGSLSDSAYSAGQPSWFHQQGQTLMNPRLLLPLLGTRVIGAVDESGKKTKLPAEVYGAFFDDDGKYRNKDVVDPRFTMWKRGFSVDTVRGILNLGAPWYYQSVAGGIVEPYQDCAFIRIGYGYRQTPYGNRYHRQWNQPTGSTLNIANATVARTDINQNIITNYLTEYSGEFGTALAPIENTAAIDAILQETAIDAAKRYQNYPAPKRKVYTPWKAIDLNGIVRQVTYAGSVKTESEAVASIGESYSLGQSPAKLKARQEMQMKQLELQAMQFNQARSDQNAIQGIPSDSKAAQAFDASNMA